MQPCNRDPRTRATTTEPRLHGPCNRCNRPTQQEHCRHNRDHHRATVPNQNLHIMQDGPPSGKRIPCACLTFGGWCLGDVCPYKAGVIGSSPIAPTFEYPLRNRGTPSVLARDSLPRIVCLMPISIRPESREITGSCGSGSARGGALIMPDMRACGSVLTVGCQAIRCRVSLPVLGVGVL